MEAILAILWVLFVVVLCYKVVKHNLTKRKEIRELRARLRLSNARVAYLDNRVKELQSDELIIKMNKIIKENEMRNKKI